jgi:hypothetical protein
MNVTSRYSYGLKFDSRQGKETFLFSITRRLALGPTNAGPRGEADHSPPPRVAVKNGESIPHTCSWRGA